MRLKILTGPAVSFEPGDDKLGNAMQIRGIGIARGLSGPKSGPAAYVTRVVGYERTADGGFQGADT
jgi:urease beta subunit